MFDLKTLPDKEGLAQRLSIHHRMIDEGPGIDKEQYRNELNGYTIPQLKEMLTYYHMKTSGSKKDLVRMLLELPIPKITVSGKIPVSQTHINIQTTKAKEDVTRLKKSILTRVKNIQDIIDKSNPSINNNNIYKNDIKTSPVLIQKEETHKEMPVNNRFDNQRRGLIRLLEKVSVDPSKYQSDLPIIRDVVNQLEKLATTSSDRKSIKRFRLILKKLLSVVPLEEAIPSTEPKSKGIVIKRPPINKTVPKDIAPVISKLQTDLELLRSLGVGSQYHGREFPASNLISEAIFFNILQKYNNPAIILHINQLPAVIDSDTHIGIRVEISYDDTNYDLKLDVAYLGQQLKYYKDSGVEIICIPFSFQGTDEYGDDFCHANMLIYRPKLGLVEHFEPHGSWFRGGPNNIAHVIRNSLENLWENQLKSWIGQVFFLYSLMVCPDINGLQKLSGEGVCALWSCFIAEFVLMNPKVTTRDLMANILDIIKNDKSYAKNIIYGYITNAERALQLEWGKKSITFDSDYALPTHKYISRLDSIVLKNKKAYGMPKHR
jgi:hypothetical protein